MTSGNMKMGSQSPESMAMGRKTRLTTATAERPFAHTPIARPSAQNGITPASSTPASANHCQRWRATPAMWAAIRNRAATTTAPKISAAMTVANR